MAGFGGVAEYGITVRWDKNFLKLIRLLLERRPRVHDVRRRALRRHDDDRQRVRARLRSHRAVRRRRHAATIVPMKNGLASGVRQASDFLMALQLTGAGKTDSVANLQVRLPVVVIGGGLTAIDTATEAMAYYPLQVEKFLARYEALVAERGEAATRARLERAGSRGRGGVSRSCTAAPRRTRPRFARGRRAGFHQSVAPLGRRYHRVSAAADRCAKLYAEPRGGREGAGGGHQLCRRPDSRGGAARRVRLRARVARLFRKCEPNSIHKCSRLPPPLWGRGGEGGGREFRNLPLLPSLTLPHKGGGEQSESAARPTITIDMPARTVLVAAGTQPNTVLGREDPAMC